MAYFRILLAVCILVGCSAYTHSQTNFMFNGGFEQVTVFSQPNFTIVQADGWRNMNGSCDLAHPAVYDFGTTFSAHSGSGYSRFAHKIEYMYGKSIPLVQGTNYVVSFWARSSGPAVAIDKLGMHITAEEPAEFSYDTTQTSSKPQIKEKITSTWQKYSYCFTADTSSVHWLIFGSTGKTESGISSIVWYYVDDVEIFKAEELPSFTAPVAGISMDDLFCVENTVVPADGSPSQNEMSYQWSIYRDLAGIGQENLVYQQPLQNGQASTINVAQLFSAANYAQPYGSCYNLYLEVFNECKAIDKHRFCFDDPRINFLTPNVAICDNVPLDLSVSGDDGWTYSWSTGQTGVGLKSVTVNPVAPTSAYTVTVTTPAGCSFSKSIDFTVHTLAGQVPPTMTGINGTDEFTYYVNAGWGDANFTSMISNNSGETVEVGYLGAPIGMNITTLPLNSNGGAVTFNWSPAYHQAGVHDVVFMLKDNNACQVLTSTYTFRIVVICRNCPVCLDLNDRLPSSTPLLPEHKAGKCIRVGFEGAVLIGQDKHVDFLAGESVEFGGFFDSFGGSYYADLDPNTCLTECNDCCDNFTGFTYDEIGDPQYVNRIDDDPTNDVFQVTDYFHPSCAYNAIGYHLIIHDRSGHMLYNVSSTSPNNECCWFESPSEENNLQHASIWWDCTEFDMWGDQVPVGVGNYTYQLKFYSCTGIAQTFHGYISVDAFVSGLDLSNGTTAGLSESEIQEAQQINEMLQLKEKLSAEISLSPNPAENYIEVKGATADVELQLYDGAGKVVSKRLKPENCRFDVSSLSAGTYWCRIYTQGNYVAKKFVKL